MNFFKLNIHIFVFSLLKQTTPSIQIQIPSLSDKPVFPESPGGPSALWQASDLAGKDSIIVKTPTPPPQEHLFFPPPFSSLLLSPLEIPCRFSSLSILPCLSVVLLMALSNSRLVNFSWLYFESLKNILTSVSCILQRTCLIVGSSCWKWMKTKTQHFV